MIRWLPTLWRGGRIPALAVALMLLSGGCECGALPLEGPDGSVTAGGSGGGGGGGGGSAGDDGGAQDAGQDGGELPPDGGCPPFACQGRCGPIRDFCRGQVVECGGCALGQVCNLATNQCGAPKITCSELGAECGTLRNSCGRVVNCGSCADPSEECDRNSNTCVPCSHVTPADLGYQCGMVFLGCGPASTLVDAGSCPAGAVCNDALKICEPQCSPEASATLCAVAAAECGRITDGCGSMVDCGGCNADAGFFCGARGVNNRCALTELPDECVAANRNCGTYVSACGPPEVNCGTCALPEVCNPNGRCGLPCAPATCASPEYVGKCGTNLDAGCEMSLDCSCASALVCTATQVGEVGDCRTPSACAAFGATGAAGNPCSNDPSPAFPSGGGTNLTCPCTGGGVCLDGAGKVVAQGDAGTCCVNTAACPSNACGMSVTNTCTGAPIACTCTAPGTFCKVDAGVCEATHTCADYGARGDAGNPCSNGPSAEFPMNATENLACPCSVGGLCNLAGSTTMAPPGVKGACCFNTAVCAPGECDTQKINTCTGATITCACTTSNTHCNTATDHCEPNLTCTSYGATGQTGAICSNGPSFSNGSLPDGGGTLLTCPCTAPGVCSSGSTVVSGAARGTCCLSTETCGNRCHTSITNACTGQVTSCECNPATAYCSTPPGVEGVCIPYDTCATYGANGLQGNLCSTSAHPFFAQMPDGGGLDLTCDCTGGRLCSVDAGVPNPHLAGSGELGSCCTNTATCGSGGSRVCNTTLTNTCTSQSISCVGCDTNYYCSSTTGPGVCLPYATCATYGANGSQGNPCSTSTNVAFSRYPGDATGRTCNCTGGRFCSVDAGVPNPHLAGVGEVGSCCTNTAVCPTNTCVTLKNTCTGADIACGCSAGYHCVGGGAPGSTCVQDRTCSSYGATGAVGNPCSTVPSSAFPDGPSGVNLTCPCSTVAPYTRNTCVGSSASDAGVCSCTPATPVTCADHGRPDGCGGTMSFPCGTGQVCYNSACCTSPVCPAGNTGDACGTITACGQSVSCSCLPLQAHTSCGAVEPGKCGCKPWTKDNCFVELPAGVWPDGCGGTVECKT